MQTKRPHVPVLLEEVITALHIQANKWYIDATLGAGGHTQAILDQGGWVLGIDQDKEILAYVRSIINNNHFVPVYGNFNHLAALARENGVDEVWGILMDLGVSSLQLDTPERGFSFNAQSALDMRMDQQSTLTAANIVNTYSEDELFALLTLHSQERNARKIAKAIVDQRSEKPITTTRDLAQLIERVVPSRHDAIHPATKTFQALRMAVNQEMERLESALPQAFELLVPGGRLAVISFHETEDRLVKHFFTRTVAHKRALAISKKPLVATREELLQNPRSRSARLRILEKL
jgi:16S rRNA (cytosine1402-N4)-methyltransferase